ncbi:hypothetical protein BLOT_010505, partial [Blomia tropicalis]
MGRMTGPIQRILPSAGPTSTNSSNWSRSSFSGSSQPPHPSITSMSVNSAVSRMLTETGMKARNIRSNSEPFLQMIKPFRRVSNQFVLNVSTSTTPNPSNCSKPIQKRISI